MWDGCTHISLFKFVCTRINTLIRLIVIDLVVILRSIWARYRGNRCIYTCAYKFRVDMDISRVFAVLVVRQNDLPPIYDWCARAIFYRMLLLVQGISFNKINFIPSVFSRLIVNIIFSICSTSATLKLYILIICISPLYMWIVITTIFGLTAY